MSANMPIPGQIVVPAAVIGFGFLAVMFTFLVVAVVATVWHLVRDRLRESKSAERKLLNDLGTQLTQLGVDDPEMKAGFARLDAAVHGEQRGEARDA